MHHVLEDFPDLVDDNSPSPAQKPQKKIPCKKQYVSKEGEKKKLDELNHITKDLYHKQLFTNQKFNCDAIGLDPIKKWTRISKTAWVEYRLYVVSGFLRY